MDLPPPRSRLVLPLLGVAAAASCLIGLLIGAVGMRPAAVLGALWDPSRPEAAIIHNLRLPRVLLGFAVGGSLAMAGAALQAVVANPLAEPWLLGLSGGAALGAVVAVVLGLPPGWSVAGCATLGALAAIVLVYRVARVAGGRLDPRVLLLAGVVTGAFASAVSTALLALADPFAFRAATMWLVGGFAGASWGGLTQFLLAAVPAWVVLAWQARGLDLLALGDDTAATLGADVPRVRRAAVLGTAVLTASSVAVSGVIGFVGLVVPHAMRWLVGPLHGRLLPAVFLVGGGATVLADTAARSVLAPSELPVGVVTALVGVPVFAALLRRSAQ